MKIWYYSFKSLLLCFPLVFLYLHPDDTQLYLHFCCNEIASSVDQLEHCVLDIGHWMSANRLKLNADKMELLFASSSHSCATLSGKFSVLQLGANTVVVCSHICLSGVARSTLSFTLRVFRKGGLRPEAACYCYFL